MIIAAAAFAMVGAAQYQVLHLVGSPTPWWGLPSALALLGAGAQEGWQRLLGGGRLDNRVVLRTVLAMIQFGYLMDVCGLGLLLPICGVLVAAVHVQWSGSAAWRKIEIVLVLMTLANQLLITFDLVPSVVTPALSNALYPAILGIGILSVANIGLAAAAREQVGENLAAAERRFRALVENSTDVVAVLDPAGRLQEVSPAARPVLGLAASQLTGMAAEELVDPGDRARFRQHLEVVTDQARGGQRWESRMAGGGRPARWLEFSANDLTTDPAVGAVVLHIRDVTARRESQDQLAYAAAHDALTGLYSRREFLIRASELLADVQPGTVTAVLFCDLDGFKSVNDTHGHDAGDEVLKIVAGRLRAITRTEDLLARMGGDEFTMVLANLSAGLAQRVVDRVRATAAEPISLSSGESASIGVSVGMVLVEDAGADVEVLIQQADKIMYSAKRSSRLRSPR